MSTDVSEIPLILSKITISTFEEVERIAYTARKIRYETPYSFIQICNGLEIYTPYSTSTKELNLQYQPSSFLTMPILYNELFFTCTYTVVVDYPKHYNK